MIFFTIACNNYLPKVKTLAESIKKNNPNSRFIVCLVEKSVIADARNKYIDGIIKSEDLPIKNFDSFIFKYSIVEASTAVKGFVFEYLLKKYKNESKIIYLDPDILVTDSFKKLSTILNKHPIIVVPHLLSPESTYDAIKDNEIAALKHGVYNLGFLAVRRSKESEKFLQWWNARLYSFCFDDIPSGLFTDQKWMNLSLCFFNVHILKDPGFDVAPWNISHRSISQDKSGKYFVNGKFPMIFFHFSGWDSGSNKQMITKYGRNKTVTKLRSMYSLRLDNYNQEKLSKIEWDYDFYTNGRRIKKSHRFLYRKYKKIQKRYIRPFDSHIEDSFYDITNNWILRTLAPVLYSDDLYKKLKRIYKKGGISLIVKRARQSMSISY